MYRARYSQLVLLVLALLVCTLSSKSAEADEDHLSLDQARIVTRARLEVLRNVKYVGTWERTSGYPMGDIRPDRGACTDLVVRSYRAAGIDLQRLVHEDIVAAREAYAIDRPDPSVDHRRVATLLTFFQRNALSGTTDPHEVTSFTPGDVVFFGPSAADRSVRPHVAIVSDRMGPRGLPLLLENGGPRPKETDTLDRRPIVGHFRPKFGERGRAFVDDGRSVR